MPASEFAAHGGPELAGANTLARSLLGQGPEPTTSTGARTRPVVGVDFHVWDGIFQGSRSHLVGLYRQAIVQAPDIDFIFFLDKPESLKQAHAEFTAPNVRLVHMPHRSGAWRLAWQLPRLQRRYRLDLLHTQYRLPFLPAGPCACTIHDLLYETHPQFFSRRFVWLSRLTGRLAARRATLLFMVSEFSRQEMQRLYGVPTDRVQITGNGIDFDHFRPGADGADEVRQLGLEPGRYLLSVGRLEPRKNHVRLLEAYARLGADSPPLVIVGQRDFGYSAVFDAIEALGLTARVKVMESVGDGVLALVMRHAQLFVYPTHAEGFGLPVAEAMACGVPVITSNTTSLPEVAGSGALLVDPLSTMALTDAMKAVLQDAALGRQLVAESLRHVRRFDWRVSAQTLVASLRRHFETTNVLV